MRRVLVALVALFMVAVSATAASAAISGEAKAALDNFEAAVDGLGGDTVEEWEASRDEVATAFANLEAEAGDELDLGALETALADLDDAIAGGDLNEIEAAGDAVAAATVAVVAQAEGAEGGDGTEAPSAVDTGSPVNGGPNGLLLGSAALLVLLAGGALVLRRTTDRS